MIKTTCKKSRVYDDAVDLIQFALKICSFVADLDKQQCIVLELGRRDVCRTFSGPFR